MPEDIIELLENLRVEPHQQIIIDIAVNEIATLRQQISKLTEEREELNEMLLLSVVAIAEVAKKEKARRAE